MSWIKNQNISIFFSEKSDGNLKLSKENNSLLNKKIADNRIIFFRKNNINPSRLVNAECVHGASIEIITHDNLLGSGALDPATQIKNTDGLITNIKNSYLMITGADCFPIFFYDTKKQIIGIAHAGWKGVLSEIAPNMVSEFKNNFGSNPADIQVYIGPGIKSCHFEVKKDVVKLFKDKYKNQIISRNDRYFIDLPAIIALQLNKAGVKPENIIKHPDCAFCEGKYFSYRRDKLTNPELVEGPEIVEAQAYIIHLK
ncbi:peptidoglycan editing factor PgeF [Candidatus Wolfebacteria bacterium]|nr:peptidoglycan editing factor PgeF [Candidatus Wolfebacteria bacterium]